LSSLLGKTIEINILNKQNIPFLSDFLRLIAYLDERVDVVIVLLAFLAEVEITYDAFVP
jgi:hypothetical protein